MMHHQYGISALYPQTSFRGENSGGVEKSQLFAQASIIQDSVVPENIYSPLWKVSCFIAPTPSPSILEIFWLFTTPTLSEFPVTFHQTNMNIFWKHTMHRNIFQITAFYKSQT